MSSSAEPVSVYFKLLSCPLVFYVFCNVVLAAFYISLSVLWHALLVLRCHALVAVYNTSVLWHAEQSFSVMYLVHLYTSVLWHAEQSFSVMYLVQLYTSVLYIPRRPSLSRLYTSVYFTCRVLQCCSLTHAGNFHGSWNPASICWKSKNKTKIKNRNRATSSRERNEANLWLELSNRVLYLVWAVLFAYNYCVGELYFILLPVIFSEKY